MLPSSSKPAPPQTYTMSDIIKYNVLIGEAELSKLKVDLDEVEFFLRKRENNHGFF